MPAIVEKFCHVCEKTHTFYLPGDGPTPGKRGEYVCPANGFAVRLAATVEDWRVVASVPKGAVKVWEVPDNFATPGRA